MSATLINLKPSTGKGFAIEAVEPAHSAWRSVLALVERTGDRRKLLLDRDGWLSARQIVLTGLLNRKPVAYLAFHIEPSGKACLEAVLDAYGIDKSHAGRRIERELWNAAVNQAKELRCTGLVGFDLPSPWK
jgi:hypothetical protein